MVIPVTYKAGSLQVPIVTRRGQHHALRTDEVTDMTDMMTRANELLHGSNGDAAANSERATCMGDRTRTLAKRRKPFTLWKEMAFELWLLRAHEHQRGSGDRQRPVSGSAPRVGVFTLYPGRGR